MSKKIHSLLTIKYNQAMYSRVVKYATNKTEFNEIETYTITNRGNDVFLLWIQNSRYGLTITKNLNKNEVLDFIESVQPDLRKWKVTTIP